MIRLKPPLKPKHIWAIRHHLKIAKRVRDLALFNCAIDAKLRGCDLAKLKVSDIAPGDALRDRAAVIQQKTGRPVPFEITEPTRKALGRRRRRQGRRPVQSRRLPSAMSDRGGERPSTSLRIPDLHADYSYRRALAGLARATTNDW
jgi:hypothetical protein